MIPSESTNQSRRVSYSLAFQLREALLILRLFDQDLQLIVECMGCDIGVTSVRVDVERALGGWVVQKQDAGDHVVGHNRARNCIVRNEMLRGSLKRKSFDTLVIAGRSKGGRFQRRVKNWKLWLRNACRATIELRIKQAQKLINHITCFSQIENWLSGDGSPGTNEQDLESNIWRRTRAHIVRRRFLCFL